MSVVRSQQIAPEWMRSYQRRWLRRDLVAGAVAGAVVVPQAMAYATIADLPPEVGLYTCMLPIVVYALLGGSRTLSVSTTSTVAVLTGSTLIAATVASSAADPARELATLTVLVGVILLIGRLVRLGGLVDSISEATLTGIKTGVGLTVAAAQLPKLVGVGSDPDATAFFSEIASFLDEVDGADATTVTLSIATIAVLAGLRFVAPAVPAPLVAVGLGIALVAGWQLDERGVALIEPVPSGLPAPVWIDVGRVDDLLGGALAIAVMCFMETASVAAAVRRRNEPHIDNDRELVANGAACVAGGLFGGMPAAGGFSQTAMNLRAGARSQLSGLVVAAIAVSSALFLGGVLSDLPEATLGCLVLVAVLGLITPADFLHYWRVDRYSFWIALVTAVAGLSVGLVVAVLVGVVLTLVAVLRELDRIDVVELEVAVEAGDVRRRGDDTRPVSGLLLLRIDGPMYTANVRRITRSIRERVELATPSVVVLDVSAIVKTSVTVVDQLIELDQALRSDGIDLWYADVSPGADAPARDRSEWLDIVSRGRVFPSAHAALRAYRELAARDAGPSDSE